MSERLRKFLAITEAAGGLLVLALPAILSTQGYSLKWWFWILLESFGGTAVAAGVWLWRGEPRGWKLSRIIQALQIVQFQTASFGIAILAGFQLRLLVSATGFTVGPAFNGAFSLTVGQNMPWWVSINFFSAYALFVLLRSGPERASAEPAPAELRAAEPEFPGERPATASEPVPAAPSIPGSHDR